MKHDHIAPHYTDTPIPRLSDEEIEARVFRNLEARQKAWEKDREAGIVILQYPETRTAFQRLSAWWHLRFRCRDVFGSSDAPTEIREPVWPRHWATVKYL